MRRSSVARPWPSGITGIAAAAMPMTALLVPMRPTATRKAVLLTGPPMSKAIIRLISVPSTIALEPVIPFSQLVRCVNIQEMGRPIT